MRALSPKRKRFFLVAILFLAGLTGWWFFKPHGRTYQGQTVNAWVRQLSVTQIGQTNAVLETLLDIGPDCLPALAAELRAQESFLSKAWQKYWPRLPVNLRSSFAKPSPRAERRATAAWALGEIGPAARSLAPALAAALNDPDDRVRAEAAQALRWVGGKRPEVISALAGGLSDKAPMVRSRAAEALWDMAPESSAALPQLIQLLNTPDQAYLGALCLQELGPSASNAVPALIEVVNRGAAGQAVNWKFPVVVGADGKPTGKDHSAHNRAMAAKALGRIGVASADVIETLQAALKYPPTLQGAPERPRPWVCQNAAEALGLLGTNAMSSIPALAQALDDTNLWALQEIALALGAMGTQARPALPRLKNLLSQLPGPFGTPAVIGDYRKGELFWLRPALARAISQIDPADKEVLAVLLEEADRDSAGRQYLAGLGATASEFIPGLVRKLSTTNGQPRTATAELLWHIDPQNTAIIPALRAEMGHTNRVNGAHAAYWYWKATGDAEPAITAIVSGLEEPPSSASQGFPQWLERMETAARPAVPALKKALWHHNVYTRRKAAKALEKIDPAALESPKTRP